MSFPFLNRVIIHHNAFNIKRSDQDWHPFCLFCFCQSYSQTQKHIRIYLLGANIINNIIIQLFVQQKIHIMSNHNRKQNPQDLHSIFRSQIVQRYPPQRQYPPSIFLEEQAFDHKSMDIVQSFYRDNEICEEYPIFQEPRIQRRSILNSDNLMASQSDHQEVPSRNSSLSSKQNNLDLHNKSFERLPPILKKYSEDMMDIEQALPQQIQSKAYKLPETPIKLPPSSTLERQKTDKINKIQQVGCNCRKSKCLKMYCECFHLQIFCSQNCNCVGCGNIEPSEGHQKAVIDALARNPKAFQQQNPVIQNGFTLGVQLAQVKKGCKCRKTKCLKKYCQCYNSKNKCGIFCKCQGCENKS